MERPFMDALLEALGPRYKLGDKTDIGQEIRYRFGKAEFHPSRITIADGEPREIDLRVDVRIPEGRDVADAEPLVRALEEKSLTPRRFARQSDDQQQMRSKAGAAAGWVRSLAYRADAGTAADSAERIRSIVETLDIPIVVGIHEETDVVAKKPLPPPKKKGANIPHDPLEMWEYTLAGGMLRALSVVINPNIRTLEVYERKLLSKKQVGDTVKLAHVAKFGIRETGAEIELLAEKRDGERVSLAKGLRDDEFIATAERLAKKVFINIERM